MINRRASLSTSVMRALIFIAAAFVAAGFSPGGSFERLAEWSATLRAGAGTTQAKQAKSKTIDKSAKKSKVDSTDKLKPFYVPKSFAAENLFAWSIAQSRSKSIKEQLATLEQNGLDSISYDSSVHGVDGFDSFCDSLNANRMTLTIVPASYEDPNGCTQIIDLIPPLRELVPNQERRSRSTERRAGA